MRLFFGLQLGAKSKGLVSAGLRSFRQFAPEVSWVPEQNLHLTMAFLGEVDSSQVPELQAATERACRDNVALTLNFARQTGAFVNWQKPQVIWLGLGEGDPMLLALHRSLAAELGQLGFPPDGRWRPHVTLGRVKRQLTREAVDAIRLASWSLPEEHFTGMTLFESKLQPTGAIYRPLFVSSLPTAKNGATES